MKRIETRLPLLAIAGLLTAAVGCSNSGSSAPSTAGGISPTAVKATPSNAGGAVKSGRMPLIYGVGGGGTVTVRDLTTGKKIYSGKVPVSSYVQVKTLGVLVGRQLVSKGPLPTEHEYEISVDQNKK